MLVKNLHFVPDFYFLNHWIVCFLMHLDTPLPQQTAYHPKGISIISASPLPSCTPTSVSSILVLINTNTSRVFHQVQPTGGMATLPEDGSLSLSDSGIYICAGPAANTSYSFHLIVFGKSLRRSCCSSNVMVFF